MGKLKLDYKEGWINAQKYIEQLEQKNAELKKEVEKHKWNDIFLEDCAGYDKKIAEEYTTLQERIEQLEKENAELKSEKGCETCTKFDEIKLTKAFVEFYIKKSKKNKEIE